LGAKIFVRARGCRHLSKRRKHRLHAFFLFRIFLEFFQRNKLRFFVREFARQRNLVFFDGAWFGRRGR